MDLQSAERLISMSDPKGVSALKRQSSDPAAAKAVAGQFGAFLVHGVMQGNDGEAMAIAGDGVGANIVSALFANTVAQAATSSDKLGLADMLFRSIEAKQHPASTNGQPNQTRGVTPTLPNPTAMGSAVPTGAGSLTLAPYWQGDGSRPVRLSAAQTHHIVLANSGKAGGAAASNQISPTNGWSSPALMGNTSVDAPKASSAVQIQSFAQQLAPLLRDAGRQLGVSPTILLAQAALETGWGRSVVGNNVFGIKANSSWTGAEVTTATHEEEAGQMVPRQASFRAYPNLDTAVKDYVDLISGSPRYQAVIGVGNDAAAYGRGLVAGGYATDTEYARKLEAIANSQSVGAAFDVPSQPGGFKLFATEG
jgi:peptidoglycan hydrolase FlgJ